MGWLRLGGTVTVTEHFEMAHLHATLDFNEPVEENGIQYESNERAEMGASWCFQ